MRALLQIAGLLLTADRWAMARGAALSVTVLAMGAALLGLSGWFITATGIAGLAGLGIAFDVFRPSAGVRFLTLGRTAARYGERLLTHDATLRARSSGFSWHWRWPKRCCPCGAASPILVAWWGPQIASPRA
ncbi:MAG: hypothetical protein NXH97_20210 [Rhodobacteraceae bacterium]|nr:hypothetical protein [Paracoccaceae bacterium]